MIEIMASLNKLAKVARQVEDSVNNAVDQAALDTKEWAQIYVPVDEGELRDSIEAHTTGNGESDVEVTAPHAPHVEYGTYKMAAQPYLRPGFDKARHEIGPNVKDGIKG